jgi:hypothetical protein
MISFENAQELLRPLGLTDQEIDDARLLAWMLARLALEHKKSAEPPTQDQQPTTL